MFHSDSDSDSDSDGDSVVDYQNEDDLQVAKKVCKCFDKNKDSFTDFTVTVGDTKFNCHRFVLSSCSGFFEALMRTDMREKAESSCTIEGISPEIFELILDVIYKGEHVLTEENMLEMWHASNQLQITFLVSLCETFVKERVNLLNYRQILTDAKLLDSFEVIIKVKEFMVNNFSEILESSIFMQLSFNDLKYILSHNFNYEPDFFVHSVLKWTCSDDLYLKHETTYGIRAPNTDESDNDPLKLTSRKGNISKNDKFMEARRRSYLGQLLALIPLEEASNKCLKKLMNNKFVLADVDAITHVNKAAATRFSATENKKFTLEKKQNTNKMFVKDEKLNSVLTQASHDDEYDYIIQELLESPKTSNAMTEDQPLVNKVAATRFGALERHEYNLDTIIKRKEMLLEKLHLKLNLPFSRSENELDYFAQKVPKSSDGHYQTAVKLVKSVGRLTLKGFEFGFEILLQFVIAYVVVCFILKMCIRVAC